MSPWETIGLIGITWVISAAISWGIYSERINTLKKDRTEDLQRLRLEREEDQKRLIRLEQTSICREEFERRHAELLRIAVKNHVKEEP